MSTDIDVTALLSVQQSFESQLVLSRLVCDLKDGVRAQTVLRTDNTNFVQPVLIGVSIQQNTLAVLNNSTAQTNEQHERW